MAIRTIPAGERLGVLDWKTLSAGDTVLIQGTEPRHERLVLSGQFPLDKPVTIKGDNPNGEKAWINGLGAKTDSQFKLSPGQVPVEANGLITLAWHESTSGRIPGGYVLDNLRVSHASYDSPDRTLYGQAGTLLNWGVAASGIYSVVANGLKLKNCHIHDCSNGILTVDAQETANFHMEKMLIELNGRVGSDKQHNVYVQAAGATYLDSVIGELRAGAKGIGIKDRSAGVKAIGLRITGGSVFFGLDYWDNNTTLRSAMVDGNRSLIQNCTFDNRRLDSRSMIKLGMGRGINPIIDVINNTFSYIRNQSDPESWYVNWIGNEYDAGATFNASGNIICVAPATVGQPEPELRMFDAQGTLNLSGKNWVRGRNISNLWFKYGAGANGANVTNKDNAIIGTTDPGFVDAVNGDFALKADAAATGFGATSTTIPPSPPPPSPPSPVPSTKTWVLLSTFETMNAAGDVRKKETVERFQ